MEKQSAIFFNLVFCFYFSPISRLKGFKYFLMFTKMFKNFESELNAKSRSPDGTQSKMNCRSRIQRQFKAENCFYKQHRTTISSLICDFQVSTFYIFSSIPLPCHLLLKGTFSQDFFVPFFSSISSFNQPFRFFFFTFS